MTSIITIVKPNREIEKPRESFSVDLEKFGLLSDYYKIKTWLEQQRKIVNYDFPIIDKSRIFHRSGLDSGSFGAYRPNYSDCFIDMELSSPIPFTTLTYVCIYASSFKRNILGKERIGFRLMTNITDRWQNLHETVTEGLTQEFCDYIGIPDYSKMNKYNHVEKFRELITVITWLFDCEEQKAIELIKQNYFTKNWNIIPQLKKAGLLKKDITLTHYQTS